MKPTAEMLLALILLALWAALPCAAEDLSYFVAPDGRDADPGTAAAPFATLAHARAAVRTAVTKGLAGAVTVHVGGGTYLLDEPLVFTPEDGGTQQYAVRYKARGEDKPVISGGRRVTGWQRGRGEVWTATIPEVKRGQWYFRQLFVDGKRGVRARGCHPVPAPAQPKRFQAAFRTLAWLDELQFGNYNATRAFVEREA